MTIAGRIDGWTQEDEDMTFGLNGYEREWKGADPPSPEAQAILKRIRADFREEFRRRMPPHRLVP